MTNQTPSSAVSAGQVSRRGLLITTAAGLSLAAGTARAGAEPVAEPRSSAADPRPVSARPAAVAAPHRLVEIDSTFFATSATPYAIELATPASDGDLWPTAWADDGALYTANGDGRGFSTDPADWRDIVANRIDGTPETGITGIRLAADDEICPVWSDPAQYNRKPTGMVAVDGNRDGQDELYLAVQDLRRPPDPGTPPHPHAFNDAPAATIVCSLDYGRTWQGADQPMFTDYELTTIFFLDFGQSNQHARVLGAAGSRYVYAYGLDRNWRDSFSDVVEDPLDLWLARIPIGSIMRRESWQFFAGTSSSGRPQWSPKIANRVPVLRDERRIYPGKVTPDGNSVVSQGSVVYNPGLKRYLYLSWTEYTWEFYEAPQPWGPWQLFLHKDFGPYPWFGDDPGTPGPKNGGYTTIAPSKFISADGRTMWLQSNWFVGVGHPKNTYNFALRRLELAPYERTTATNPPDPTLNLARSEGIVVIDKTCHYGRSWVLNDGSDEGVDDSWDQTRKELDRWGYEWPGEVRFDRVVYTTGLMFVDGGWFAETPRVQVRRQHRWIDLVGVRVDPAYPADASAGPRKVYTFTFDAVSGDGVRLIGRPGGLPNGDATFTSIAELAVYYDG